MSLKLRHSSITQHIYEQHDCRVAVGFNHISTYITKSVEFKLHALERRWVILKNIYFINYALIE